MTHRVGLEVKRLRGPRPVQWLSDRTAELGHQVGRSRISDLERGDRGGLLDVAELLVLAAALQVPPVVLLFRGLPSEKVDVLPEDPVESWDAVQWFTGESRAAGRAQTAPANTVVLDSLRELKDADRRLRQAATSYEETARRVTDLEARGEGALAAQAGLTLQALGSTIVAAADRCNGILRRLREQGVTLSDTERWWDRSGLAFEPDALR